MSERQMADEYEAEVYQLEQDLAEAREKSEVLDLILRIDRPLQILPPVDRWDNHWKVGLLNNKYGWHEEKPTLLEAVSALAERLEENDLLEVEEVEDG